MALITFMGNTRAAIKFDQKHLLLTSSVKKLVNNLVLEIAPGPINRELVINFTETTSNSTITITDLKGAKILSQAVDAGLNKTSINVSKLEAGTYFVVFTNGEARTSKLFVKQ